ncbi:hypothetical protein QMK61_08800 [Fulvimonas sp. R45]|uniref:hypothetical protein n=1 Tax=Fulvimonas sp. R45 TaxID=3045937 RepID=UPI00265F6190|nr:hypothetical protein [Fulvimonas sp. R45]MDO1528922.1 hypothetical protein [Fulvimonas sp. R45]
MKRAARHRLALLAGVAALLALALWQWRVDRAAAPGTLLDIDPAAVTAVELQLDSTSMHYARRDGHWWRTDGTPARADDARIDALAAIAAAPVGHWRPAADFDAAKVGLAAPHAVLTLDGHALRFGAAAAIGHRCYVQRGARVALVSLRYMPQAPRSERLDLQ